MTTECLGMQIKKQSILKNNQEIHLFHRIKPEQFRSARSVGEMGMGAEKVGPMLAKFPSHLNQYYSFNHATIKIYMDIK